MWFAEFEGCSGDVGAEVEEMSFEEKNSASKTAAEITFKIVVVPVQFIQLSKIMTEMGM